jgi:hypothetical protein
MDKQREWQILEIYSVLRNLFLFLDTPREWNSKVNQTEFYPTTRLFFLSENKITADYEKTGLWNIFRPKNDEVRTEL